MKSSKEMIETLLKKGMSKRRISKILGVQWSTVNNWHKIDQHPKEDSNLQNLLQLYKGLTSFKSDRYAAGNGGRK